MFAQNLSIVRAKQKMVTLILINQFVNVKKPFLLNFTLKNVVVQCS